MNTKRILALCLMVLLVATSFGFFQNALADVPPILLVKKTADGTSVDRWNWTIEKAADRTNLTLPLGETDTVNYGVTVNSTLSSGNWTVTGEISFRNVSPTPVTVTEVQDVLSDGTVATVTCPFTFPFVLYAGYVSPDCTYSASGSGTPPAMNTATVMLEGGVIGGSATVNVVYSPSSVIDECIDLSDTFAGNLGTVCADVDPLPKTFTYSHTIGPYNVCGEYTVENTASFVTNDTGTTGSDSETVFVDVVCNSALQVTKTADGTYDNVCKWTIVKHGDQTGLIFSPGQNFVVNYDVVVDVSCTPAATGDVSGSIEVSYADDSGEPLTITTVADLVGGVTAAVDCGVTFPYELPLGSTLSCTYSAFGVGTDTTTNTATAVVEDGSSSSGTSNIPWSANTIDGCVDVSDDHYGDLGSVCEDTTFTYSLTVGPYSTCGLYEFVNTASFTTNDTGTTGSSSWLVQINVPCGGCTLTPGYWKTHSNYGPAPYDDTWALLLPNGEDTTFYLSGKSYYDVLWTNPRGGNAYYILAHQFIAAVLNKLNGASSPPTVDAVLAWSNFFFNTHTPSSNLTKPERSTVLNNAFTLDQYNNGYTGPGHCSDNNTEKTSLRLYFDQLIALPFVRR